MEHFQNKVEVTGDCKVITNPHNHLTINLVVVRSGTRFYTSKTAWNYVKYVLCKALSYFKWLKKCYSSNNNNRWFFTWV